MKKTCVQFDLSQNREKTVEYASKCMGELGEDRGPRKFPTGGVLTNKKVRSQPVFIEDGCVIDLFENVKQSKTLKWEKSIAQADKIQGRWLLGQEFQGKGLSACTAMLILDGREDANPLELLTRNLTLGRSISHLRSVGLICEREPTIAGVDWGRILKLRLLQINPSFKASEFEWASLILTLNPSKSKTFHVIVDEFDAVTKTVFIRDPYHRRSLSIHLDHLERLNVSRQILTVRKALSRKGRKELSLLTNLR